MPAALSNRTIKGLRSYQLQTQQRPLDLALQGYERERYEDVGFMTAMTLVLLGNYSQTGHFGGPLAYTPYNVALHLGGPELGGLRYDLRRPKFPYNDKFAFAGGHCVPTAYALWMILYEALRREHQASGDAAYAVDPRVAILPIDCLGFRRAHGVLGDLLQRHGLADHPLFAQAKLRGIRALAGHTETTDATNDVNGGPSGIAAATLAGKALFWDLVGAEDGPKVIAFEGEFAMTEGHAQEMKTQALAQQVGKRLRIILSFNNAGIDDRLLGGVIAERYQGYDIPAQWASYGWNVFTVDDGADYDQIFGVLKTMEDWPADDRRPMIAVSRTVKGWWPVALEKQVVSYPSHPYAFAMNDPYFVQLARSYEARYGVKFEGIDKGPIKDERERLIQFMTNMDVALSVMEKPRGLRTWIAEKLLSIAKAVPEELPLRIDSTRDPFRDDPRLKPENLPREPYEATLADPHTGQRRSLKVKLFEPAGAKRGTRRAISEIGKWMNYVSGNRFLTIAADLSESINVEHCHFFGHYDPLQNPGGTRLKAGIQEAVNAATIIGAISQTVSKDPLTHVGYWGLTGTYGAFTPLMYLPARVFSQQNQDSPFRLGVLTILAGHSGPETAADARTHFGIFSPQVWQLFPRGQIINLYFWDYNDVAPGYFQAVQIAAHEPKVGIISVHVARPDAMVADRSRFADTDILAAAKGCYLIREFKAGRPALGTVLLQGSSSTVNAVRLMDRLEAEDLNVRLVAVISEELFDRQDQAYRDRVLPPSARYDCMFVTSMTKRVPPLAGLGPLTEEYSLSSDADDRWRTGGLEPDVIAEAHIDEASILEGLRRFVRERPRRLSRQREALARL